MNQVFAKKFFCLFLFLIFVLAGPTVCAGDWPNWRGPDYNGISQETGWDALRIKQIAVLVGTI